VSTQTKATFKFKKPPISQAPGPEISPQEKSSLHQTLTEWFLALAHQRHPLEQPDIDAARSSATALLGSALITLNQQQEAVEGRIEYLAEMIETELSGSLRNAVYNQREG
jgi:hypothetical protein